VIAPYGSVFHCDPSPFGRFLLRFLQNDASLRLVDEVGVVDLDLQHFDV
jgi:hypothetical protein